MRPAMTVLLLCAALAACGGSSAPPAPPPVPVFGAQAGYPRVSSEIVAWLLERDPVLATTVGEHAHDTTLGAYFAGDLERAAHDARALLTRLEGVHRGTLERPDYFDHRVLEYALRTELLELEELGSWQRDPVRYVDLVERGTLALLDPELGLDAHGAVQSLVARWNDVPLVFRAARQNLDAQRVPPAFARTAAARAARLSDWFRGEQAAALRSRYASDRDVQDAMARAHASVDSFGVWVGGFADGAIGGFRLGSDGLRDLIRYTHHTDLSLSDIDALNRRALVDYREWLDRVALDLDPIRPPAAIVDSLVRERPDSWRLLSPLLRIGSAPDAATRPRRVAPPAGLIEAWAHYTDLAAIESEGASNAERLAAIRRALHAHALLHATIQLHAANASIDEVALQLAAQAFLPREAARAEAERIAYDPLQGLIALDRMQIFALRERLRAARGGAFDADDFAQQLLDLRLPVPLAAEAMLGHEPERLLAIGARTPGVPEPPRVLD